MPETMTLIIAVLAAGIGGWLLASFLKARDASAVASELARTRADFEARLADHSRVASAREAELTTVRTSLDEAHAKLTSIAEDRARLAALHESAERVGVERTEELARLQSNLAAAENVRDTARDRITTLEADLARVMTALDQERRAHNEWQVASRQSETEMKAALGDVTSARDAARDRIAALETDVTRLTTTLEQGRLAYEERLKIYQDAEEQFKAAVKATAADALNANNEAFLTLAQERLGTLQHRATADFEQKQKAIQEIVAPVASLLDKLQSDVKAAEQNRIETRTEIISQVRQVAELVPALQKETSQLARSLRHSGSRGRWGELQLRRSLELAGLVEGHHYTFQARLETEEGRLIPDVIIHLPGGGHIVIDAKAPMQAFLDAHATDDDDAKALFLEQHLAAVRQHVNALGAKAYAAQVDPSPDFVVMYVPVEAALSEALSTDTALIEEAAKRDVVLAGPLILIGLLRAIAFGWRQHQVAERAEEIAAIGADLHDRIATVVGHFVTVGRRLDKSVEAYNNAAASLQSRLVPSARQLKLLHVKTTKDAQPLMQIQQRSRILGLPEGTRDDVAEGYEAAPDFLDGEASPEATDPEEATVLAHAIEGD
jgi:DNA recombination protein RmuC